MRADRLEHRADESVGCPACERDCAAGARYADELRCCASMVGGEHRTEDREHSVERLIGEGDRFGVSLPEVEGDSLGCGALTSALEQCRDVVDPAHEAAEAGGGEGRVAASGRHVEHAPAGP